MGGAAANSYARLAPRLALQVGRYAHAKQFKRIAPSGLKITEGLHRPGGGGGGVMRVSAAAYLQYIPAVFCVDRITGKLALVLAACLHQPVASSGQDLRP